MVKVTGPAFSMGASGTLGDVISYQKGFGGHRATRVPTHKDGQHNGQLRQRSLFFEAKEAWNALGAGEKASYNEQAQFMQMTGYNLFIKQYIATQVNIIGIRDGTLSGTPVLVCRYIHGVRYHAKAYPNIDGVACPRYILKGYTVNDGTYISGVPVLFAWYKDILADAVLSGQSVICSDVWSGETLYTKWYPTAT